MFGARRVYSRSLVFVLPLFVMSAAPFFRDACLAEDSLSEAKTASKGEAVGVPQLRLAAAEYDFGTVSQGSLVTHEFELENAGKGPLHIQRIVPACGCTASSVDKDFIAPGETGKVKVEFDTSGFSGEKVKTVRLYTNDPEQLSTLLRLKGVVQPDVVVEPKRVYFGDLLEGGEESRRTKIVTVQAREEAKITLGEVSSRSKKLEVELLESSKKRKKIRVTVLGDADRGELRERVVVQVSGGKQRSVNIPVFASVKGPLRIRPASVAFGVIEGREPLRRSIKIENVGPKPVVIAGVSTNHPAVKATHKVLKQGKVFVVQVEVQPELVTKELRASLAINTDIEDEQEVKLSVYGILPPKA